MNRRNAKPANARGFMAPKRKKWKTLKKWRKNPAHWKETLIQKRSKEIGRMVWNLSRSMRTFGLQASKSMQKMTAAWKFGHRVTGLHYDDMETTNEQT
jgi:hypothetical protein